MIIMKVESINFIKEDFEEEMVISVIHEDGFIFNYDSRYFKYFLERIEDVNLRNDLQSQLKILVTNYLLITDNLDLFLSDIENNGSI